MSRGNKSADAILMRQYAKYIKDRVIDEYVEFRMSPKNPRRWYARIHDLAGEHDEFINGEYLIRIDATNGYPYDPPEFRFLTNNGVYDCKEKVCTDMSPDHPEGYPASIGLMGYVKELVFGMICWSGLGLGRHILHTNCDKKKCLALASHEYNLKHHSDILQLFQAELSL